MPNLTTDTERAIRAFAAYFEIHDQKEIDFWLKQWKLSNLTVTKPKKNEDKQVHELRGGDKEPDRYKERN